MVGQGCLKFLNLWEIVKFEELDLEMIASLNNLLAQ